MPKVNLLSRKWCSLVFENRNKEYGAYVLRRDEGAMLTRALAILVAAFVLTAVLPLALLEWQVGRVKEEAKSAVANLSELKSAETKSSYELKAVDLTRKVMVRRMKNALKFVPEISEDESADSQFLFGADEAGSPAEEAAGGAADSLAAGDSADAVRLPPGILPPPVEVVEQMPQFPGGLPALMKWLDGNVRYPPQCIRDKVGGRVEVSFCVSREGEVAEPEVTKRAHPLLDREAMLAVLRMPRWTPGKVDGRASAVRVTIPIEFSCGD